MRTANPSEALSRTPPLKLQTEPRGEKHVFRVFPATIRSLVLETQHLRIMFEVWDPDLGCLVLDTSILRIHFEAWDPDPIFRENVQNT